MGKLKLKYYAIGHSYLKHGPFAGWQTNGFWGMAASAPEKDYFHRLQALLSESVDCEIEAVAENHAELEWCCKPDTTAADYTTAPSYLHIRDQLRAFKPNLITVFLDANCICKEPKELLAFYDALYGLIAAEKQPEAVVLCPICFTPLTKAAAEKYGFIPVDVMKIHEKKAEREQNPFYAFKQYPVYHGTIEFRTHPGDEGHEFIAQEIFKQIKEILPRKASAGKPLPDAQSDAAGDHALGKWSFDTVADVLDLEIGGFNLRVENSCLRLSAAVDTGLSVGCKNLSIFAKELIIRAAVHGESTRLNVAVYGEKTLKFSEPLKDTEMHEYRYPLNQTVSGFSIAPDGFDCHIYLDEIALND